MTKECRSPNDKMSPYSLSTASVLVIRHLSLVRHSLIRASPFLLLIFLPALQAADNISVVGSKPQWSVLEHYQETITRDDFARLIQSVYCTHGFAPDLIEINEKTARIMMNRSAQEFFALRFAANDAARNPVPRLWRPAKSLPAARPGKPLSGLNVALDPGHLGGSRAKQEHRWCHFAGAQPFRQ